MTITKLTEQLLAVEVPKDAFNIGLKFDTLHYDSKGQQTANIELPEGNYTILGEVSMSVITFDCFDYLDAEIDAANNYEIYFANYCKKKSDDMYYEMGNKHDSFSSLLESKGCKLTESNKYIILKTN
jgi:hypothetical protein